MMQEEDCLDLTPTAETMAGANVAFDGVDNSGPTLLLAASTSELDSSRSSEESKTELATKEEFEIVNKPSKSAEDMVTSNGGVNNDLVDRSVDEGKIETTVGSKDQNDDSNRVKELFGSPSDGESFGAFETKSGTLSTASALFGNVGSGGSSDLFGREERADSFSKLINTEVDTSSSKAENQKKEERHSLNSLDNSFQGLEVNEQNKLSSFPSTLVSSRPNSVQTENKSSMPNSGQFYQQNNFAGSPQVNQVTQSGVFKPSMPDRQASPLGGSTQPTIPIGCSAQQAGVGLTYAASQNQIPLFYNPQSQQQQQVNANQSMPSTAYDSQEAPHFQNGANVGNSYMYTSPISSIMPSYEPSQGSQLLQKQGSTRLHQSHVPKQTAMQAGELFVPDLYGHSPAQPTGQVNIFTPSSKMTFESQMQQNLPQMDYGAQNMSQASYTPENQYPSNIAPPSYNIQNYEQFANQANFYPGDSQDPGFWEWVKNQDWSEGAQKLGKQILQKTKCTLEWVGSTVIDHATKVHLSKNATDTVLTTLDPGMEEFLNPLVHLAIASQDNKILQGVRQGFKHAFGHTSAKGHGAQHSLPKLPIGFEYGAKAVTEQLDAISTIDFQFNQPFVYVALQPFLTELQRGSWSCMFCLAVRDCARQIQLQTYSQPISIPAACISIAFSRTAQDNINYGLDVSIDEAVRLYKPYAGNEDWCSTLTGIKLETIIALAAQGLASDYKREMDNPVLTQSDSFVVLPS